MSRVMTVAPLYSLRKWGFASCAFVSQRSCEMMTQARMTVRARRDTAKSLHAGITLLRFHIVENIILKAPVAKAVATTWLRMRSMLNGLFAQDMPLIIRR